jgi:transposase-like protein
MRHSKYNDEMKRSIINEYRANENITIAQICNKYKISNNSFHLWKRKIDGEEKINIIIKEENSTPENQIEIENKTLRRLYINLSEHNHELAKFLKRF